jgi:hypothetical protein
MKKSVTNQSYEKYLVDLFIDTPEPAEKWRKMTMPDRINLVKEVMSDVERSMIDIRQCNDNGYVYIALIQPLTASSRGLMLLDFELKLKDMIDEGITIWHTPQGDKSSLRRLRGVEVRS